MEYIDRLMQIGIKINGSFTAAKNHHSLTCMNCNHIWSATPISKIQAFKKRGDNGCPNCAKQKKDSALVDTRAAFIAAIESKNITILSTDYTGCQSTKEKIHVKFNECGHETEVAPGNIIHRGVGCSICAKASNAALNTQRNQDKHVEWAKTATDWQIYRSRVDQLTRLSYKEHVDKINPNKHIVSLAGNDGYQLDHIVPVRYAFDHNIPLELIADYRNLQMIKWQSNLFHSDNLKGAFPQFILDSVSNIIENKYLSLFKYAIPSAKPLYDKMAVNAFQLSDDLAVIVATDIHVSPVWLNTSTRFKLLNQQNELKRDYKRVIVITSDEINDNIKLVQSKLQHLMNANDTPRIHARQCIIRILTAKEKNTFLNANHLQGADTSAINLGAVYNDEIQAVMTFCKPRVLMGRKQVAESTTKWELSRFATNSTYRIPGIASKLLKHFQRTVEWDEIYSYADARWSNGNVYTQLGFSETTTNGAAYWYVNGSVRKHRWGFRKDILKSLDGYNPTLTEYQNVDVLMPEYKRLYDSGTIVYSMTK